jgi:predicted Zn finger-like uncharacterized protein
MDVQCDRCKTEYEFDDALVSGRGTTVKCTNCGFQFKVHKQGADGGDDRWVIRTTDHRELVFHTLKDLQKAILAKQVGKHDTLARGTTPPRALGAIAELSPFFEEQRKRQTSIPPPLPPPPARRSPSSPGLDPRTSTQIGVAPPPPARRETPMGLQAPTPPPAPKPASVPPPAPAPLRSASDTLRPPESGAVPPPTSAEVAAAEAKAERVVTQPIVTLSAAATQAQGPDEPTVPIRSNGARIRDEAPVVLKPPPQRTRGPADISSPLPPAAAARERLPSYDDAGEMPVPARARLRADIDSQLPSQRPARRVGGWVIAAMLIVSVGVGGVIVGQRYMPGLTATPTSAPLDPRAQEFLRTGERALDDGDLETAKESFDKASVITEKDPRVLLDLARLATIRADIPWLKLRLSPQDAGEDTKRSWTELSAKAKTLADTALAAAPDDSAAVRVKMDALRIAGEREQARGFVTKIIMNAQQPETAYVLAALDLAEPEPLFKTIIERLRLAAQAEGNSGRARAALVYALARSGDGAAAKTELERLGLLARPHPLLGPLKTFVEKAPQKADGGVAPVASGPVVDVNNLPRQGAGGGGGGAGGVYGDSKSLVAQANTAMRRGDYERANTLFSAALDKNPGDSEAAAGLGDVARAQHNTAGARASYQRAVQMNGHYLPALIGLADAEWDLGDKASAQKRYKDMVENFPDGALPAHVKSRAEGGAPAPTPPAPTSTPAPTTTTAPAPTGAPSGTAAP